MKDLTITVKRTDLIIDGKPDKEGDVGVGIEDDRGDGVYIWLDKVMAMEVVRHLTEVFK